MGWTEVHEIALNASISHICSKCWSCLTSDSRGGILPAFAWVPLSNESTKPRWTESTADQVLRHIKVSMGIKSCTVIQKAH